MEDHREVCAECGFDSARWRVRDAITLFGALGWWWRHALAGVDEADAGRRPAPAVWSPLEYGVHSAYATAVLRQSIERVLGGDGWAASERINPPLDHAAADDEPLVVSLEQVLDDLEREGRDLAAVALDAGADGWARCAERAGRPPVRADTILFHAAHDAGHHQMDVGRGLSALGVGTIGGVAAAGRVVQVNTSAGGVPKMPVEEAEVGHDGVVGDRQADRKHHGRPFQAVCLWSTDAIADLTAAGHHVRAGSVGENLTVDGLDWTALRPGTRLRVGSTLLLELSFPAVPCQKQAQWFADRDFTRLAYENNPQWTRWYAWVREPGPVAAGDDVLVV